jgi:hypothetical protein
VTAEIIADVRRLRDLNRKKLDGKTLVKAIPDHIRSHLLGEISGYNKVIKILENKNVGNDREDGNR